MVGRRRTLFLMSSLYQFFFSYKCIKISLQIFTLLFSDFGTNNYLLGNMRMSSPFFYCWILTPKILLATQFPETFNLSYFMVSIVFIFVHSLKTFLNLLMVKRRTLVNILYNKQFSYLYFIIIIYNMYLVKKNMHNTWRP